MPLVLLSASFGLSILATWFLLRVYGGWKIIHQQFIASLLFLYGLYLLTLTGTETRFVLPVLGVIGSGAAAGAAIGFGTYLAIGAVGVATGGAGIALGGIAMSVIGATLGAAGGSADGFGFKQVSYFLINPLFLIPLFLLSIGLFVGAAKRKKSESAI